ncbi:MAG: hypothetical protein MI723_08960, partial [Caulobacterales bacterium]|nr:hypothetical protein [Caulobacterales bacterium]
AALGQDGEYVLAPIGARPPKAIASRQLDIPEEEARRMRADADRHAGESLRRIRQGISSSGPAATGDAFSDLLAGISWRELIHTSYFEYDAVAELIAAAIAEQIDQGGGGEGAPSSVTAAAGGA